MIVMCSCGRVKIAASTMWATAQPEICWAVPVDLDPSQPGAIARGLCPECVKKVSRELDEMEKKLGFDEIITEEGD